MKKSFILLALGICLAATSFAQTIYKNTKVKILEIASSDTYYSERADFIGKSATALGDLTKGSDGYYSGTLDVENGRTVYFKSVRLSTDAGSKTFSDTKSDFTGTIEKGTRFKIVEVPSDDAYYSDRSNIEGKMGTTTTSLTIDDDGYTSGSLATDDGKSYYFYKVKLGKGSGSSPSSSSSYTSTSSSSKTIKYVTGTLAIGTYVYVADISPDDSYYADRDKYIAKRGKVITTAMTMKDGGYYAGDFKYDDGSTAYFYKAKFSREPVDKSSVLSSSSSTTKTKTDDEWDNAKNDDDISEGDKVEIIAVSPDDSYYDDKDKYIGKKGTADKDIDYDDDEDAYGGTVKLDNGDSPYFYSVRMKKLSSSSSTTTTSSSSSTPISKGTRVVVTDIGSSDSYYSNKSKYIGKTGKVAEGLTDQGDGYYSGKVVFDDGTDAYFFKAKITVLK